MRKKGELSDEGNEVLEFIKQGKYKNTLVKPIGGKRSIQVQKLLTEYKQEEQRLFDIFKDDIFRVYGVHNNLKRELCFELSLTSNFRDTLENFDQLVELIK